MSSSDGIETGIDLGFPGSMTKEQEIRLEVTKSLLPHSGGHPAFVREAERIVDYILNGKKDKDPDAGPKIKKRIPVSMPGSRSEDMTMVQAYIKDDNTIEIEFRRSENLSELWNLIGEDRLFALSFSYIPSTSVNTVKDN